jgi:ribosomal protein L37AE/L43A
MASTTKTTLVEKEVKKSEEKGCKPSHKSQREAIGAGYLVCESCKQEIPNDLSATEEAIEEKFNCKPPHKDQREQIGAGYLVCETCKREIPN